MILFKRSRFLLVTFENLDERETSLDRGRASLVITALLSGEHLLSQASELEKLRKISDVEWTEERLVADLEFGPERMGFFVGLGILLSNSESPEQRLFLSREKLLIESGWPPCAAAYHLINHHQESRVSRFGQVVDSLALEHESEERATRFIESHGMPPAEFYDHPATQDLEHLPLDFDTTALSRILLQRRTCRHFEPFGAVGIKDLSQVLRLVFGPVAVRSLAGGAIRLLMKTSPSGGSLHPIEAFPLIFRCSGERSGLYHYRGQDHSLALLKEIPEVEARNLAVFVAQGQAFVGTCSIVVVLVARFERNFWKYRERENTYAVVHQDLGHLSQAFQLVATDLGLGSFYTAAINSDVLVELLALRYPAEAPLGLLGLGISSASAQEESSVVLPFSPGTQA